MGQEDRDPFGWLGHMVDGKYRVDAVVGEGGFGVVYRAMHLGLQEPVALKALKIPSSLTGEARAQFEKSFLDEGRLLHKLSKAHAGIAQALDVGAATSPAGIWTPYLVLEWLVGRPLDEALAERRRAGRGILSLAEAVGLLLPAIDALAEAHAHDVAHRDIKPANLFLAQLGTRTTVKVLDFGIAKVLTHTTSLTRALEETGGSIKAFTPQYGAPEQFDSNYGATGPWTDVFALALILVEMLTGRPALEGQDTIQLMVASANPNVRPTARRRGADVPAPVEEVIVRALAVQPRERILNAGQLGAELRSAMSAIDPIVSAPTVLASPQSVGTGTQLSPGYAVSSATPIVVPSSTTGPQVASIPRAPAAGGQHGGLSILAVLGVLGGAVVLAAAVGGAVWWGARTATPAASVDAPKEAASAPIAAASTAAKSAVSLPSIPKRTVGPLRTADGDRWINTFQFELPDGAKTGLAWAESRGACQAAGLDLCTEDQWTIACSSAPEVAKVASWTVTYGGTGFVVRGGDSCGMRSEHEMSYKDAPVTALCCERRASLSSTITKRDAMFKEADVYVQMIEKALNARTPTPILRLIAEPCELFGETGDKDHARKSLEWTYQNWPEFDSRLVSCEVSPRSGEGEFECETVMTRLRKSQTAQELSVFRQRYEYGGPGQKYSVFGRSLGFTRRWGPM